MIDTGIFIKGGFDTAVPVDVEAVGVHVTGGLTIETQGVTVFGGLTVQGASYLANGYSLFSDRNLKKNIQRIKNSMNKVNRLRGVYYNWADSAREIDGSDLTTNVQVGLLAQDLQAVLPEVVMDIHNGRYLGVKYDGVIPLLIEALKEIDAKGFNIEQEEEEEEESKNRTVLFHVITLSRSYHIKM